MHMPLGGALRVHKSGLMQVGLSTKEPSSSRPPREEDKREVGETVEGSVVRAYPPPPLRL